MLESASRSVDRLSDKISEAKQNDAQRLQDEYAKLVEGMQDSDAPLPNDEMAMIRRQEEDVLSNPGVCKTSTLVPSNISHSTTRRPSQRGYTWKYSQGRAFHCLLEKICRIFKDSHACSARRRRDPTVLLTAPSGYHLYREEAIEVGYSKKHCSNSLS